MIQAAKQCKGVNAARNQRTEDGILRFFRIGVKPFRVIALRELNDFVFSDNYFAGGNGAPDCEVFEKTLAWSLAEHFISIVGRRLTGPTLKRS